MNLYHLGATWGPIRCQIGTQSLALDLELDSGGPFGTKHPTVREIPGNATAGGDIPSGSGGSQGIAVSNVFWWHRVCSRNI